MSGFAKRKRERVCESARGDVNYGIEKGLDVKMFGLPGIGRLSLVL